MEIRPTTLDDLPSILEIYKRARAFMKETGNDTQWGNEYPQKDLLVADILDGNSYVCMKEGQIAATFFYKEGEDATYQTIYDGEWLNDSPYAVVHRIAVDQKGAGIVSFCLKWAYAKHANIKIDTHGNNKPMQHALKKNGFVYCGKIHVADGSERIAFQKI